MDAKTRLCAVIGHPIGHSLSPQIHNAAFSEKNLNYVYVAFEVQDVRAALEGVRALGIAGLSVTIPHKVAAMQEMDMIDPIAEDIGCINTVVNQEGQLLGLNTDGLGALNSLLESGCDPKGKNVLLLGSGGAARAIAFTLAHKETPQSLTILGIEEQERSKLARDLGAKTAVNVREFNSDAEALAKWVPASDVIIHCTPVGMYPKIENSLVPPGMLRKNQWVFDVVYNPLETLLIRTAKQQGCQTVRGIEMFVRQAVAQFELWTRESAPVKTMFKVVQDALKA